MVYAVDSYGVVVEVEAELVAHGGEFAGAFAEDVDELLCGCGFDASVVSFELGEDEVEFGFGFFEVWYVFFAGSGSGELVDESFAFVAAFVLADDDAGVAGVFAGLFAVGGYGFAEFVVGVLQIGDMYDCGVG